MCKVYPSHQGMLEGNMAYCDAATAAAAHCDIENLGLCSIFVRDNILNLLQSKQDWIFVPKPARLYQKDDTIWPN
eukprot:scaffold19300_cov32-Attheya_sp.AAC.1